MNLHSCTPVDARCAIRFVVLVTQLRGARRESWSHALFDFVAPWTTLEVDVISPPKKSCPDGGFSARFLRPVVEPDEPERRGQLSLSAVLHSSAPVSGRETVPRSVTRRESLTIPTQEKET